MPFVFPEFQPGSHDAGNVTHLPVYRFQPDTVSEPEYLNVTGFAAFA